MKKLHSLYIILAGIFWGSMGLFVREFSDLGFSTLQIVAIRMIMGAIIMLCFLVLSKRKEYLHIGLRDFPLLASIGLFSLAAMSIFYFTTIELTTMSVAAILLYLSPVVVMVLSILIFKEKLTFIKLISLVLAVLGCFLVSGFGESMQIGFIGFCTGVGSAIAYALYSILGNFALKKYHPYTVTFWAFMSAGIPVMLASSPITLVKTFYNTQRPTHLSFCVLGIGAITAVIPYVLYTVGLKRVEPSKAAIFACSEPVAATLMGIVAYEELPNISSVVGILLVLTAIVLLNLKVVSKTKKSTVFCPSPSEE